MVKTEDPYEHVSKGKLKLKGDSGVNKKKKKKDKKILGQISKTKEMEPSEEKQVNNSNEKKKTNAELAYQKMQEKMVRILCICSMLYIN